MFTNNEIKYIITDLSGYFNAAVVGYDEVNCRRFSFYFYLYSIILNLFIFNDI